MNITPTEAKKIQKELAGRFIELGGIFHDGKHARVTNVFFMVTEPSSEPKGRFDFDGRRMQSMEMLKSMRSVEKSWGERPTLATFKLNPKYLKRVFDILGENEYLTFSITGPLDAVKIATKDGKSALIMPLR